MMAHVKTENLQLRPHPVGRTELGKTRRTWWRIASEGVEAQLLDIVLVPRTSRSTSGKVGSLQQQVTSGHSTIGHASLPPGRTTHDAVNGVEGTREHEPLGDGLTHSRAMPEVRQRRVGAAFDDALHL